MTKQHKLIAVLSLVVVGGGIWWLWHQGREDTDNAYVKADILPVMSRVAGTLLATPAPANRLVQQGDVLLELDPAVYQTRLGEARAVRAQAEASLNHLSDRENAQKAQVSAAQASVAAADAEWRRTVQQTDRLLQLQGKQYVAQDDLDAAELNKAAAAARLNQAKAQQSAQQANLVTIAGERPLMEAALAQAKAAEARAELELSYTQIRAPRAGVATSRQVQVGQSVEPGIRLMSLVTEPVWIYANYKETQVAVMKAGDEAEISVDAIKGKTFKGHVDSFFAATGSEFALLPPQNATGNFTKVIQRVPVKILFDEGQDLTGIRPGMSLEVTVFTE
ncbi:HlyD family secretion protein [Thalassolituus sp. LLYu03]|uniref:HlyD family secretion protein n=1 Tax=Thalassolituus sp. LLYu03 TaxID=3421656 RepID=UPI003D2A7693